MPVEIREEKSLQQRGWPFSKIGCAWCRHAYSPPQWENEAVIHWGPGGFVKPHSPHFHFSLELTCHCFGKCYSMNEGTPHFWCSRLTFAHYNWKMCFHHCICTTSVLMLLFLPSYYYFWNHVTSPWVHVICLCFLVTCYKLTSVHGCIIADMKMLKSC